MTGRHRSHGPSERRGVPPRGEKQEPEGHDAVQRPSLRSEPAAERSWRDGKRRGSGGFGGRTARHRPWRRPSDGNGKLPVARGRVTPWLRRLVALFLGAAGVLSMAAACSRSWRPVKPVATLSRRPRRRRRSPRSARRWGARSSTGHGDRGSCDVFRATAPRRRSAACLPRVRASCRRGPSQADRAVRASLTNLKEGARAISPPSPRGAEPAPSRRAAVAPISCGTLAWGKGRRRRRSRGLPRRARDDGHRCPRRLRSARVTSTRGCAASAEDDRDPRYAARSPQILDALPRKRAEADLPPTMRARGDASGYSTDTQKLVAARLARIAVETNDAALARWLLDVSGTSAAQAGRRRRPRAR